MKRHNLVVVRAGKSSLHQRWLDISDEKRSYDLVVSYFDESAFAAFSPQEGVTAVLIKGGKWDGLFKTFAEIDISAYDYFWLPDDDISCSAEDVNMVFHLCRAHGLVVAQPSLTRESYYSHFIFSQCPGFRLRYTNYVEIMVPCLHRDVLSRALPLFETTMSGFGLDYIWCRFPESGAFRVGILDAVAVHHTRPVGKVLNNAISSSGRAPAREEEAQLKARFSLARRTVSLAYAGIREDGQPVVGRLATGWRMLRGWWPDRAAFADRKRAYGGMFKIARRQVTKRLEMEWL